MIDSLVCSGHGGDGKGKHTAWRGSGRAKVQNEQVQMGAILLHAYPHIIGLQVQVCQATAVELLQPLHPPRNWS